MAKKKVVKQVTYIESTVIYNQLLYTKKLSVEV